MGSAEPLRVLILTYYWPPAGGPGVQRWLKLSKYLAERGAEVEVITVDPSRATWPVRDEELLEEVHAAVQVHHTATFEPFGAYLKATGRKEVPYSGFANEVSSPGFRQRAAKWIRGNLFLPDARKGWNRYALKKAEAICVRSVPDVLITTGPPHSTHLIGSALKKSFGLQWIADFRDPWTDIYYYDSLYPTPLARRMDRRMEQSVLEEADHVLASSPFLKELLQAKTSRREGFHFFPNGYDPADLKEPAPSVNTHHLVYTGTLTELYPIHSVLEALEQIAGQTKWTIDLFGHADDTIRRSLEDSACSFQAHGFVSHQEAVQQMQSADVLLLVIPDQQPNKGIIPGKIFEYMGSGRPVLGIGPTDCDAAQLIQQTGSGAFFGYQDTEGIQRFLESPARTEAKVSVTQYSRPAQAEALEAIVRRS